MDVLADRYELGATLGAGGMARVVQAHDRLLDREVAVKLLRDDIAMDPSARERFLREARTAARFNHPNAVAVYDTGQDGRQPWIVMELVRGEDLAQRLAHGGALDEAEAVRITDAVLSALGAAHRDGMVHRDVKPANIMLLDDGGVKLADFGIAKSVQDATAGITATGQIIGTAKYLSPEQVEGRPATPASDVYATGVVLYEMLAGEAPYTGDSAIAVALAHTREPVPDIAAVRRDVSPTLAAVIERAMAKDSAARFADAEDMRRALAGERVAAPVAAAPTAVLQRDTPTRVLRERPAPAPRSGGSGWIWALLLVGLAAIGGALLLNAFDGGGTDPADTETEEPAEDKKPNDKPTEDRPAEEDPEPTEPPAPETEAPPPAEEEEDTEAPPPIPEPTDIESLITFLDANPDRYGARQKDLRKELDKVNKSGGPKQAEAASQLSETVVSWSESGDLDPSLAQATLVLLAPVAAQEFGEGDDADKGEGKGRGKDKEDED